MHPVKCDKPCIQRMNNCIVTIFISISCCITLVLVHSFPSFCLGIQSQVEITGTAAL